ncbi:membrane protein of ER body-like protein isoform X2 [Carica papaya]|uniref:membrane protein of ER body-like protein isoform X2 n=1 Tax=Carica papaya TaxID=3649 RepID=UPI000B8C8D29|nr:membrane protein of ER body-like protein isoform X2 [Carica papaya]
MSAVLQRDEEEHIEREEVNEEEEEQQEVSLRGRRKSKSRNEQKENSVSSPIGNGDTTDSSRAESESPKGREQEEYNELHQHYNGDQVHVDALTLQQDGDLTSSNRSVYFDQAQGTELTDGDSCIENGNQESFIDENLILEVKKVDIQNSTTYEPNHQFTQNSVKGSFSGFNPSTLEDSSEGQNAGLQFESKSSEDSDEIEEVDQEGTDLDVERVLKEQDTHELYCPNCHSCITRRVILLRRKRKVRKLKNKPKHEKVETVDPSNLIPKNVVDSSNLVNNSSTGSQTPEMMFMSWKRSEMYSDA